MVVTMHLSFEVVRWRHAPGVISGHRVQPRSQGGFVFPSRKLQGWLAVSWMPYLPV